MANDFVARQTLNGLGTFSLFTAPSTPVSGVYFVDGQMTLPTLVDGGGVSEVVATIYVNSVGAYTGVAGATGFQTKLAVNAGEEVEVVLSSSADADQLLNAVKGYVSISFDV